VSVSRRGALPTVAVTRGVPGEVCVDGAEVRTARTDPRLSRSELLEFVRGARVLVTMFHDVVDRELLDAAGPGLRGVCAYAVGTDNIDLAECEARGVRVLTLPDVVTEGTANLAWGLILSVSRRMVPADRYVRSGAWAREGATAMTAWLGRDLADRLLVIVGAGRIGKAVALRGRAFGMRVGYVARSRHEDFETGAIAGTRMELDAALAEGDVVSVHVPMSAETRGLLDERRLGLLKPTAILVNTARGGVMDEAALVRLLAAKRIWGAGLDVFAREPELAAGLSELENVVLSPHVGSAEERWRLEMTRRVSENAERVLRT
jgi:glyoxylate reductase